jgi:uncharacterized membrane protein
MPTGVAATILHIPAILGGILEGPLVGALVGFFFGLFSFLRPSSPIFSDPLVAFLPRLFIGVVAYYIYRALGETRLSVAVAAVGGTLTNTVGVLGLILLRGYLPLKAVLAIAATHGIPEIVVSVIIVTPVALALRRYPRTA